MPDPPKVYIRLPDGTQRSLDPEEQKVREEYLKDHGEIMETWRTVQRDWMPKERRR